MNKNREKLGITAIVAAGVLLFAAMLSFAVYLFGFGGYWRIMNAPERRQIERLLNDKYGEEFVCLGISPSGGSGLTGKGSTNYVRCAPVRDKTLVFEVKKHPDHNELLGDYYAENLAERQLKEMMLPEISGMWDSFAVYCNLYNAAAFYDNKDVVNKIREGDADLRFFLDELSNDDDTIVLTFTVCVNDSTRNLSYEEEWEGFHKAAENLRASLSDFNVKIQYNLFFPPSGSYKKCAKIVEDYYSGSTGSWNNLKNVLNWEIDEASKGDSVYHREIDIDTTHQAENNPKWDYPHWFDTAEDYAEYRAEMKTEN